MTPCDSGNNNEEESKSMATPQATTKRQRQKKKKAEMETLRDQFFTVETQVFQANGKLRVSETENVNLKE